MKYARERASVWCIRNYLLFVEKKAAWIWSSLLVSLVNFDDACLYVYKFVFLSIVSIHGTLNLRTDYHKNDRLENKPFFCLQHYNTTTITTITKWISS